jgi:serine/threonine protein kinase/WD40 repeat protein
MEDLSGKSLGQYEITDVLGKGGMAAVYRAYQAAMNRYVAIKVLPPQFTHDESFVERFLYEARIIARLEHRAILPVYDFGTQGERAYIVMRIAEGGTLAGRLEAEGPLPVREVIRVVKQLASGLDYAHKAGVVHRDLKPQNILIDAQGDVYLSDFGIAKVMETTARLTGSELLGTPMYMAPEQGQGASIDYHADIYALGAVIYEMLTGQVPYTGDTPLSIVYRHVNDPVPSARAVNPSVPVRVDGVVRKAMAKSPGDRFESAGVLANALEMVVLTRPVAVDGVEAPAAKVAKPPRKKQRRGWRFWRRAEKDRPKKQPKPPASPVTRLPEAAAPKPAEAEVTPEPAELEIELEQEELQPEDGEIEAGAPAPEPTEPGRTRRVLTRSARLLVALAVAAIIFGAAAAVLLWLTRPQGLDEYLAWPADLNNVWGVTFSPAGERLATANGDGTVRLWNPENGQDVGVLRGHQGAVNDVAYRPDGAYLATAGADGTLRVWSPVTGDEMLQLKGHTGPVLTVTYSPDGWRLASGGEDGTLRLWRLRQTPGGAFEGEQIAELSIPNDDDPDGGPRAVTGVAFSPDSSYLAVAVEGWGVLRWELDDSDVPDGQPLFFDVPVRQVAFDLGSDLMAVGGTEDTVNVWRVRSEEGAPFVQLQGGETLRGLAFSPDGKRIASARSDGVRIWALAASEGEPGEVVERLNGELGSVCGLDYSPSGVFVVAVGCNGRVHVWDMTQGGEVAVVSAPTQTPSFTPMPTPATTPTPTLSPTPTRSPTLTLTPTETLMPAPLLNEGIARTAGVPFFEETFSNPSADWILQSGEVYSVQVLDGALEFAISEPLFFNWVLLDGRVFDDFIFSADLQLVEGENENYGVIFRHTENDDFYLAQFVFEEYFELWEYRDGEFSDEPLLSVYMPELIKDAGQLNHLRIEAVGPWLSFFVNGEMVASIILEGDVLLAGEIGVFFGSVEDSEFSVTRYDNVSVRAVDLAFIETFDTTAGGWLVEEADGWTRRYDDGAYVIEVSDDARTVWSFAAEEYTDVVIEADITYRGDADNAAYGVVCRQQEGNKMYEIDILPDQQVVVGRRDTGGAWVERERWSDVSAVNPGEARNLLRVACVGDTIDVAVNGVYLGSVTDATYRIGRIGLAVGSLGEGGVEVAFGGLVVTAEQE